jgi:hypothetical protein
MGCGKFDAENLTRKACLGRKQIGARKKMLKPLSSQPGCIVEDSFYSKVNAVALKTEMKFLTTSLFFSKM